MYNLFENLENVVGYKTNELFTKAIYAFENLENAVEYKTVSHAVIH